MFVMALPRYYSMGLLFFSTLSSQRIARIEIVPGSGISSELSSHQISIRGLSAISSGRSVGH